MRRWGRRVSRVAVLRVGRVFRVCAWATAALLVGGALMPGNVATPLSGSGPRRSVVDKAADVLIVGGGPDAEDNQVAIESNVGYVLSLYSRAAHARVLFADGRKSSRTVLCERPYTPATPADAAMDLLLDDNKELPTGSYYRSSQLPQIDGPSSRRAVASSFSEIARRHSGNPILLYFTGHGSEGEDDSYADNEYLLWNEDMKVPGLARQIARLPVNVPIALVMSQCYAGAFADTIFHNARHGAPIIPQNLGGFFGTTEDRTAAGCTPDVDQADYEDFTTYFMAALSGRDRLGGKVTGADFNHDGEVGMDEAFCYALIHDPTVDVPVCTSDAFLRDRVHVNDDELFRIPLSTLRSWATPAQQAALDALATSPMVSGPAGRLADLSALHHQVMDDQDSPVQKATERYDAENKSLKQHLAAIRKRLFARWPALRGPSRRGYPAAKAAALADLGGPHASDTQIVATAAAHADDASRQLDSAESQEAYQLRLLRLAKTIALSHQVLTSGPPRVRADLERILRAERRPLFPHRGDAAGRPTIVAAITRPLN